MGHHEYRPLADMLVEVAERYGKPMFIAETGAEGSGRAVLAALCLRRGAGGAGPRRRASRAFAFIRSLLIPAGTIAGIAMSGCCRRVGSDGKRHVYEPLRQELERQRAIFGVDREWSERARRLRLAR